MSCYKINVTCSQLMTRGIVSKIHGDSITHVRSSLKAAWQITQSSTHRNRQPSPEPLLNTPTDNAPGFSL